MQRWESLHEQMRPYTHFSYEAVDVSSELQSLDFPNLDYTALSYARLLIPYLPIPLEQVIYLDCDTICLGKISDLLQVGSTDSLLNAVRDTEMLRSGRKYTSSLGLTEHANYFNTGVLVLNTNHIRGRISKEDMLCLAVSRRWEYADQCLLNVLCDGRASFLPFSWNVMTDAGCNNLPRQFRREYKQSQIRPNIIHYVWDKPWQCFYITPRTKPFWKYAQRTPFAAEICSRLAGCNVDGAEITSETMRDQFLRYNRREGEVIRRSMRQWVKRKLNHI